MELKVLYGMLFDCWKISLDYYTIDKSQQDKPIEVSVGDCYPDTWKKQQLS